MVAAPVVTALLMAASLVRADAVAAIAAGPAGPAPPASGLEAALPVLTACWLVGTLCFQLRLLVDWGRAERLRRRATEPLPRSLRPLVAELVERIGVRQPVRVVRSCAGARSDRRRLAAARGARPGGGVDRAHAGAAPRRAGPRARARAPTRLPGQRPPVDRRAQPLFYHPAVWWLSGRIRAEREFCCDDTAVAVCGDALLYARALSTLDEWRVAHPTPALAANGEPLMNRICRLVGVRVPRSSRSAGLSATVVFVLSLARSRDRDACAGEEPPSAPRGDAIEWIDVASVAEAFDLEDADMFVMLRELGLDNATLLQVMQAFGADDEAVQAVHRLAEERMRLEGKVRGAFAELQLQRAEGEITDEEFDVRSRQLHDRAMAHFEEVQKEVIGRTGARPSPSRSWPTGCTRRRPSWNRPVPTCAHAGGHRARGGERTDHARRGAGAPVQAGGEGRGARRAARGSGRKMEAIHAKVAELRGRPERRADPRRARPRDEAAPSDRREPRAASRGGLEAVEGRGAWGQDAVRRITQALESGRITEEEAHRAMSELAAYVDQARAEHEAMLARAEAARARVAAMRERGLTEAQIDRELHEPRERAASRPSLVPSERSAPGSRRSTPAARPLTRRSRGRLDAGEIAPEEAERRLAELRDRLHAAMREIEQKEGERHAVEPSATPRRDGEGDRLEELRDRLVAARRRLDAAAAAGEVTDEEAGATLRGARAPRAGAARPRRRSVMP